MRIAIATTQSRVTSTLLGRVLPLAEAWGSTNEVHLLALATNLDTIVKTSGSTALVWHTVGKEPFNRSAQGKQRLGGIDLVLNQLSTTIRTALTLQKIKPERIIISKALPANVAGVWLYRLLHRFIPIILDVDDYELASNQVTSLPQRAALHWAERMGSSIAQHIVAATPFLVDHYQGLVANTPITLVPTGITLSPLKATVSTPTILYVGSVSVKSGHNVDLLPAILQTVKQRVPQVTLSIAGDGDDVATLQNDFKKLGLSEAVKWLGRFTLDELPHLLASSTVLIDPINAEVAQRAKSSFRVVAAMTSGLPVVTSNVGVRPYLIPSDYHNRFFATPGNANDYAEKIIAIFEHPLSDSEAVELQRHSAAYQWDVLAKQYETILVKPL